MLQMLRKLINRGDQRQTSVGDSTIWDSPTLPSADAA
jgi:hypothetical protein